MDDFLDLLGIYITINPGKTSKEIKIQDNFVFFQMDLGEFHTKMYEHHKKVDEYPTKRKKQLLNGVTKHDYLNFLKWKFNAVNSLHLIPF